MRVRKSVFAGVRRARACSGSARRSLVAQRPGKAGPARTGLPSRSFQASPLLLKALATGQQLGTVEVDFVRAGGAAAFTYLTTALSSAAITTIGDSGAAGGGSPTESVGIRASSFSATYTPQNADASADTPVSFCYDFRHKKTC